MGKRNNVEGQQGDSPPKKAKLDKTTIKPNLEKDKKTVGKDFKKRTFNKPANGKVEKPEDWKVFKQQKKELKLKRKQGKQAFDVIVEAKRLGELLRRKTLKGGDEERNILINKLHNLLKDKGHYAKFVVAHDTARIVQWLLKYSSDIIMQQIAKELIPVTINMLQSKYGIHCAKHLLKHGTASIRSEIIDKFMGHAVKLTCNVVSAPVVEFAYTTYATPKQKQLLQQEFYGDLYKNSKDEKVKHISDVYKDNNSLKAATLGATKENLLKVINKSLLDSALIHSVLAQFFEACSEEDRTELISLLASHIVVISNSKDGALAAMQCIWHGSNKDRKVIMKTLKEHLIALSKHEYGHWTIITLLDSTDDTVLLNKIIISQLIMNAKELTGSDAGRKVLMWLVTPVNSSRFHVAFIQELNKGREKASCKKSPEIRRKEILSYSIKALLGFITDEPDFWLANPQIGIVTGEILKAGSAEDGLQNAFESIVKVICSPEWKVTVEGKEVLGIEDAGLHMVLKQLATHDKINLEKGFPTFSKVLAGQIEEETVKTWVKINRGCFVLLVVYENGDDHVKTVLKNKVKKCWKLLEKSNSAGAKLLVKKLS